MDLLRSCTLYELILDGYTRERLQEVGCTGDEPYKRNREECNSLDTEKTNDYGCQEMKLSQPKVKLVMSHQTKSITASKTNKAVITTMAKYGFTTWREMSRKIGKNNERNKTTENSTSSKYSYEKAKIHNLISKDNDEDKNQVDNQ